uniref:Uncharacterized protein n=1 Tax=Inoviridae sp. ct1ro12 TaxID=2826756 RepID=A0A8S5R196_9VIRU|nr:MAG TPA: hypothetical protein [Inoviridae sp. ct1ro12]
MLNFDSLVVRMRKFKGVVNVQKYIKGYCYSVAHVSVNFV